MKAAEAIVKFLVEEGVDTVFGYPGGYIVHVYEALRKSGIRHVLYARSRQPPTVQTVTPGSPVNRGMHRNLRPRCNQSDHRNSHCLYGFYPVGGIDGQVPSSMIGRDVFQEADITGATDSFTKHNYLVKDASQLPRIFREAFHIASTGRPGPVLIDLPHDIQTEDIPYDYPESVQISGYKPTFKGHMGQIKRALKAISESERPLISRGGVNLPTPMLTIDFFRKIGHSCGSYPDKAFRPIILIMRA